MSSSPRSRARRRAARRTTTWLGGVAVLVPLVVAGCGEDRPTPQVLAERPERTIPAYDAEDAGPAGRAALSLVPADATIVTVTDFDASRQALGVPDLTSGSLVSERTDYWERARRESVLLAEGRLHEHDSVLLLDHGFTSDDVDWEARFLAPDGPGWVLGLRPDLDMSLVRDAVDAGVAGLAGADVDEERHLVSLGAATDGEETWAVRDGVADLAVEDPAESTYYRAGCVPLGEALGPDAGVEEQDALLARHDPRDLEPLDAFAVSFGDGVATARLGLDRPDLLDRSALAADFPSTGTVGFGEVFANPVVDPSTGRIGWSLDAPAAAAGLVLTDVLPFAVCPEVTPMEEPTGL